MTSGVRSSRPLKRVSANTKQTPLKQNERQFWEAVNDRLEIEWQDDSMVRVLSPRQNRKYELALAGLKKFKYILDNTTRGYIYCPLHKHLFEKHLHDWNSFGLLDLVSLEEKYKKKVQPPWLEKQCSWHEIMDELKGLAEKQVLSKRFAQLWELYVRRSSIVLFIDAVRPYAAAEKSKSANISRIVERYLYAIWMHRHGYKGGRNKGQLGTLLVRRINDTLENSDASPKRFKYYRTLISSEETGLLRSVTDMTPEEIADYAGDEFFTSDDFPEVFSAP